MVAALQNLDQELVPTVVPRAKRFTPRSIFDLTPDQFSRLQLIAKAVAGSQLSYARMGDRTLSEQDVMIVMLKGMSLGFSEMTALEMIDLIGGKPALKPQGMMALIYDSGELEAIKFDDDGTTAIVTVKRKGMPEHIERFSMEDAGRIMTKEWGKTVPLSEKSNWKSQPRVMRMWRCIAAMARKIFSDIIQGMYPPEELNPDLIIDETGNIVIETPAPAAPASTPQLTTTTGGASSSQPKSKPEPAATTVEPETPGVNTGWVNAANLNKVLASVRKVTVDNLSLTEMARLAGVTPADSHVEWFKKYTTGKAAQEAIKAAFDAEMQPPASPEKAPFQWTQPLREKFIDDMHNLYRLNLVEALALIERKSLDEFGSYDDVMNAVYAAISAQQKPICVTSAKYIKSDQGSAYTVLDYLVEGKGRHVIPLRMYGTTEIFKAMGWGDWAENVLKKNSGSFQTLPFPCLADWSWGNDAHTYATVNKEGGLTICDTPF